MTSTASVVFAFGLLCVMSTSGWAVQRQQLAPHGVLMLYVEITGKIFTSE